MEASLKVKEYIYGCFTRSHKQKTQRVHTSFLLAATNTGRVESSSDPNLQNIPIKTSDGREIRKSFLRQRKITF